MLPDQNHVERPEGGSDLGCSASNGYGNNKGSKQQSSHTYATLCFSPTPPSIDPPLVRFHIYTKHLLAYNGEARTKVSRLTIELDCIVTMFCC